MTNEELVQKIQSGENTAENSLLLWQQMRGFIHSIAARYEGYAETEDLEQEGFLALCDAIAGYDPEAGSQFITYAGYWIRQRMNRYLEKSGVVHIPIGMRGKLRDYEKFSQVFEQQEKRRPTDREAAYYMRLSVEQVKELQSAQQMAMIGSLDSPITNTDGDKDATAGDLVASGEDLESDVLDAIWQDQLKTELWQMVEALEQDQAAVIRMRFQKGATLQQAGEVVGCTAGKARQIELKGIRELGKPHNAHRLRAYLPEAAEASAYHGSGAERFNRTWTSSTERVALRLYE